MFTDKLCKSYIKALLCLVHVGKRLGQAIMRATAIVTTTVSATATEAATPTATAISTATATETVALAWIGFDFSLYGGPEEKGTAAITTGNDPCHCRGNEYGHNVI